MKQAAGRRPITLGTAAIAAGGITAAGSPVARAAATPITEHDAAAV